MCELKTDAATDSKTLPGKPFTSCHRLFFFAIGATLLITLLVVLVIWPSSDKFDIKDPSYRFTFCALTSGTNHTVVSGRQPLGWLNWKLSKYNFRPISRDRIYTSHTPQDATILSIGFTQQGNELGKDSNPFSAVVVQPGGRTVPLRKRVHLSLNVPPNEHVAMWLMPNDRTNFLNCELRLSNGGKDVASIWLR